jgi:hypothetical protein
MADINNIVTLQDLKDVIEEYLATPRRPPLTGAQLNILLSKTIELSATGKVDKIDGFGLSENNFSDAAVSKLASLINYFKGSYISLVALQTAHPTAVSGDEALVDSGVGTQATKYIWDASDNEWVPGGGTGASTFTDITGQPRDNGALNDELSTLENGLSNVSSDNITLSIFKVSNYATL